VGSAIVEFTKEQHAHDCKVTDVVEILGLGFKGFMDGKEILVGNAGLMKKYNIVFDAAIETIPFTVILVAINQKYADYFIIANELKEDAKGSN